jgi:hypothetical protein
MICRRKHIFLDHVLLSGNIIKNHHYFSMKNFIKKFIVLGAFALFALAGVSTASAYVNFSPQPGYTKITRISNYTDCPGCVTWTTGSISAEPGDEITVDVTIYNTGDTTATGVRAKITPEDTAALLTHTRTGQIFYTGGSTSPTSVTANVTGGLAQTLEYVPGTFRYYEPECADAEVGLAGCTVYTTPPFGGSVYDVFGPGVSVGSVIADDYPAHVQVRFRVGTATPAVYDCNDGSDNDGDGLVDMSDPGCSSPTDNDEYNTPTATYACSNGSDDDGDGLVDMSDPGCSSPTDTSEYNATASYECSDGYDNDGDGDTDMYDAGCTSATDDSEDSDDDDNDDLEVDTLDAENIEEEEAELVGEIDNNDDNQDLEVYFYISEDEDDEDDLIEDGDKEMADDNFDDDDGEFSEVVDNLDPDTKYYFIACYEDEDGDEECGNVESFYTGDEIIEEEEPDDTPAYTTPTVVTTVVTQVTGATARLNGLLSSDGNTASTAWFEWGTSNGLGFRTADQYLGIGDGKAFGNDIFGLSANTTYYFRACARNTGGTQCGNVLNFRTVSTNNPVTPVFTGPTVTTVGTGGGTSRLMLEITSPYENACPADINDYTVKYKNISGRTLTDVILRVTLPADVMFRKSSAGDYTESDKTLTVELDELATNEEGEIFLSGEVMRGVSDEDIMVATAVMAYTYSTTLGQEDAIAYKIHDVTRCGR